MVIDDSHLPACTHAGTHANTHIPGAAEATFDRSGHISTMIIDRSNFEGLIS